MVQSIERAFALLRSLKTGPAGISELANAVGLPKSTVSRLLATLEGLGAVERGREGFRIGPGLADLAGAVDASAALAEAVRPHLVKLAEGLGEAAGLSVPVGYTVHYLVQVESPNPVQVRDYSGLMLPMHVGPSGLCIMSQWPAEEVRRYLMRPLEAFTARTMVDPEAIVARLARIRREGVAWVEEEFAEGISSVAAPVFDDEDHVLGAIHVHGPAYRFPPPGERRAIAEEVKEAADRFSRR